MFTSEIVDAARYNPIIVFWLISDRYPYQIGTALHKTRCSHTLILFSAQFRISAFWIESVSVRCVILESVFFRTYRGYLMVSHDLCCYVERGTYRKSLWNVSARKPTHTHTNVTVEKPRVTERNKTWWIIDVGGTCEGRFSRPGRCKSRQLDFSQRFQLHLWGREDRWFEREACLVQTLHWPPWSPTVVHSRPQVTLMAQVAVVRAEEEVKLTAPWKAPYASIQDLWYLLLPCLHSHPILVKSVWTWFEAESLSFALWIHLVNTSDHTRQSWGKLYSAIWMQLQTIRNSSP